MPLNSPQSDTLVRALVDSSSFLEDVYTLSSLNGRSSTSQLPSCSRTSSSSSHTSVTVPVQRNALPEPMPTATDTHRSTDSQSQSGPSQDAISAPASTGSPAPESGLPPFATASCVYQIGSRDVESSLQIIRSAYAEAVHYRPNLFSIPSGTVGTQFVNNLSRFFKCCEDQTNGLHQLGSTVGDHTVYDILKEKHPSAELLDPSAVIPGPCPPPPHSILFTALDRKAIRKAALKTTGPAGPSGMDAGNWRRVCTSFGSSSDDLCDALASCARRIASSTIDPAALEAYVACRLIPLDKHLEFVQLG